MTSGIYIIEHLSTGKLYLGGSRNIEEQLKVYWSQLKNGRFHNASLQQDWTSGSGDLDFDWEVIASCPPDVIRSELKLYRASYARRGQLYSEKD